MIAYICPTCGARLLLSGPKRPAALARIISAHEESDQHIAATRAAVLAVGIGGITPTED